MRHADAIGVLARCGAANAREQRVEALADRGEPAAQAIRLDRILDIHRGRAEMQLAAAERRLRGEDADLGHQIVPDLALDRQRRFDIDVVDVRAQIVEFGLRDEAAAELRRGERDPDLAPETAPLVLGEQPAQTLHARISTRTAMHRFDETSCRYWLAFTPGLLLPARGIPRRAP